MNFHSIRFLPLTALVALSLPASAAVIGQIDNFEDGTSQNWVNNLLGFGGGAPLPTNVGSGGPGGANDNYLKITSLGGSGTGSRLVALNVVQWAGNYAAAGITGIAMDLNNLGNTDLQIRLYLENPMGGPPTDEAISTGFVLPTGSGWQRATFQFSGLTALNGNSNTLLGDVTAIRIVHSTTAAFPPAAVVGVLGVDNITAIPEPSSMLLLGAGVTAMVTLRRLR